jgi:hypothetical protein
MSTPAAEEVVAAELVAARREGRSLTRFPGVVPASMAEAYQIQELVMSRWQDSPQTLINQHVAALRASTGRCQPRLRVGLGPFYWVSRPATLRMALTEVS